MGSAVLDPPEQLSTRADADDVRIASEWLERVCRHHEVPADQISRLDLCLNEALANVIAHGGASARSAPVLLALIVRANLDGTEAALTVSDQGRAFNPLAVEGKSLPKALAEAEPGGLGLVMMSSFSDELGYRYGEGRNHLTFAVRWSCTE